MSLSGPHFWCDIFDALQRTGKKEAAWVTWVGKKIFTSSVGSRGDVHTLPLVKMLGQKNKSGCAWHDYFRPSSLSWTFNRAIIISRWQAERAGKSSSLSTHFQEKKSGFSSGTGSAQIDILLEEVAHQFKIVEEGGIWINCQCYLLVPL